MLRWSNLSFFLDLIFLFDVEIYYLKSQFMRGESQLSENIWHHAQTTKLNSVDKIQQWIEFKELTDDAKFSKVGSLLGILNEL